MCTVAAMKQLQQLESSTSESDALKQAAIEKLSKERDDLFELTKSRDRVIQVSSSNNKNIFGSSLLLSLKLLLDRLAVLESGLESTLTCKPVKYIRFVTECCLAYSS